MSIDSSINSVIGSATYTTCDSVTGIATVSIAGSVSAGFVTAGSVIEANGQ